jgi:hypothetical protein
MKHEYFKGPTAVVPKVLTHHYSNIEAPILSLGFPERSQSVTYSLGGPANSARVNPFSAPMTLENDF